MEIYSRIKSNVNKIKIFYSPLNLKSTICTAVCHENIATDVWLSWQDIFSEDATVIIHRSGWVGVETWSITHLNAVHRKNNWVWVRICLSLFYLVLIIIPMKLLTNVWQILFDVVSEMTMHDLYMEKVLQQYKQC